MDKKPFDHIENKIKAAAEDSSQHPFEEQSWDKMETLLDKGKKRGVIAWWWLALPLVVVAGAGSYLFTIHSNKINSGVEKPVAIVQTNTTTTNNIISATTNNKVETSSRDAVTATTATDQNTVVQLKKVHTVKFRTNSHIKASIASDEDVVNTDQLSSSTNNSLTDNKLIASTDSAQRMKIVVKEEKPVVKKDSTVSLTKTDDVKKKPSAYRFYALASGGVDAADVHFMSFKNSTVTPRFGVGIGYHLNNRFSIQTGFYTSRKKYITGPGDYKAPAGTYLSTVDISKVAANCLVFDIPVTIRYDFIQRPAVNYYATVGISSFIMKNEAYNYNYTDAGVSYQSSKTYTGNQNLFSIFNISIGVEKHLSNRFSLLAEPSVSIPLAGVGAGSVRLYSTAVMVGLKYKF